MVTSGPSTDHNKSATNKMGDKSGHANTEDTEADTLERESEQRPRIRESDTPMQVGKWNRKGEQRARQAHPPHTEADTCRIQQ